MAKTYSRLRKEKIYVNCEIIQRVIIEGLFEHEVLELRPEFSGRAAEDSCPCRSLHYGAGLKE